ncbi:hypothetical protein, partial [Mycobacterium tuberculosis]|uniref:hypothetical protein n=1 Tax=Mycobacterium tuberculosis TaxID=1773 RepID=UPI001BE00C0F
MTLRFPSAGQYLQLIHLTVSLAPPLAPGQLRISPGKLSGAVPAADLPPDPPGSPVAADHRIHS